MKTVAIFCPALTGGGAEKAMAILANQLSGTYRVILVGIESGPIDLMENRFLHHILIFSKVRKRSRSFRWPFYILAFINWLLFCVREKPNIVHANCELPSLFLALTPGKFKRVITLHIDEQWAGKRLLGMAVNKLLNLEKATWTKVSIHIPNILGLKADTPCKLIPNSLTRQVTFHENFISKDSVNGLAFIGRFHKQKNPIQALKIAMEADLPIVFVGEGALLQEIQNYAKIHKFDKVKFEEFSSNPWEKVPGDYLTLATSEYEGDGLLIVEALTLKRPICMSTIEAFTRFDLKKTMYLKEDLKAIALSIKTGYLSDFMLSELEFNSFWKKHLSSRAPEKIAKSFIEIYQ